MTREEKVKLILDRVSEGVWDSKGGTVDELFHITQCVFCCVSPESEHHEHCPVRLARELEDE
jgi:hypothetical protein